MGKSYDGRRKQFSNLTVGRVLAQERVRELRERAARLDREADFELQAGHDRAAERLSHRAAEMRGEGGYDGCWAGAGA